ncbi:MAG: VWA domain-containing protein, partial [Oscillibacter sp.]|nr:VWA domain-containing protein [Oscillibacter sp.]
MDMRHRADRPGRGVLRIAALLLAAGLAVLCGGTARAKPFNPGKNITGYDMVMVFDTSASMARSDPNRAAKDAAAMFVDSLYIRSNEVRQREGIPESAVGIVKYAEEMKVVRELSQSRTEEAAKAFQKDIYDQVFPDSRDSDAGLGEALLHAVRMLQGMEDGREKRIVLFTDGYAGGISGIAPSGLDPLMPYFGGKGQDFLEEAMILCRVSGCAVYVIGLDQNGSMTDAAWEQFRKIANYTQVHHIHYDKPPTNDDGTMSDTFLDKWVWIGGFFDREDDEMVDGAMTSANYAEAYSVMQREDSYQYADYFRAKSVSEVQDFYVQLTAVLMTGGDAILIPPDITATGSEYLKTIESEGNSAAVFYIMSEDVIRSISLEGPSRYYDLAQTDGDGWVRADDDGWVGEKEVRIRWWQGYTTVTVVEPERGDWWLTVRGTNERVKCIIIGGITLELNVVKTEENGNHGTVMAQFLEKDVAKERTFYEENQEYQCMVAEHGTQMGGQGPGTGIMDNPPAPPENEGDGQPPAGAPEGGPGGDMGPMPNGVELTYDEDRQGLTGEFYVSKPGEYDVTLFLTASGVIYTKQVTLTFSMPADTIPVTARGKNIRAYGSETGKWNTIPIEIPSWTNISLNAGTITCESADPEIVKAAIVTLEDGTAALSLHAIQNGKADVALTIPDFGTLTYAVQAEEASPITLALVLMIVGILAAIALLVVLMVVLFNVFTSRGEFWVKCVYYDGDRDYEDSAKIKAGTKDNSITLYDLVYRMLKKSRNPDAHEMIGTVTEQASSLQDDGYRIKYMKMANG